MKKVGLCLAFGLVFSIFAFAGGEKGTWKGWLSDGKCGEAPDKAMSAGHKGCAVSCVKGGDKWVLVESGSKSVLRIHNQDAVKEEHIGHEVTVMGTHKHEGEPGIHVESIAGAM